MFFFGILGISSKEKELRDINNIICKKCSSMTTYKLIKVYNVFHIFFIPIIRWGEKYYLKSRCCGTIFEVSKELCKRLETEKDINIKDENINEVYSGCEEEFYNQYQITCNKCGNRADSSFKYCPYCGEKLR